MSRLRDILSMQALLAVAVFIIAMLLALLLSSRLQKIVSVRSSACWMRCRASRPPVASHIAPSASAKTNSGS
ncbi:MAG: hypothetical protein H6962_00500 [Chromatiaceae bacterium]|nr:hypothetical protein [Chromatiaceae bacterium]